MLELLAEASCDLVIEERRFLDLEGLWNGDEEEPSAGLSGAAWDALRAARFALTLHDSG